MDKYLSVFFRKKQVFINPSHMTTHGWAQSSDIVEVLDGNISPIELGQAILNASEHCKENTLWIGKENLSLPIAANVKSSNTFYKGVKLVSITIEDSDSVRIREMIQYRDGFTATKREDVIVNIKDIEGIGSNVFLMKV